MYASGDSVTLESKKIGEETISDCPPNQHTRATCSDKFGAIDLLVVTQLRKQKADDKL